MTTKKILSKQSLLLENLEKYPIIQVACEKTGIARSTYYRWIEKNAEFQNIANKALQNGKLLVNDIAEANLISLVRGGNYSSIIFWLNNNHPNYSNKNLVQNIILQTTQIEKKQIQNILSKLNTNEYEEANKKRNGVNDK